MSIDLGINNVACCFSPVTMNPIVYRSTELSIVQKSIHHLHVVSKSKKMIDIPTVMEMEKRLEERDRLCDSVFPIVSKSIVGICRSNGVFRIVVGDGFIMNNIYTYAHLFPYHRLYACIQAESMKYQISTHLQDETHTSQMDALGVRGRIGKNVPKGVRVGPIYLSSSGHILHADVNGAINIYRKHSETKQNCQELRRWLLLNVENIKNPVTVEVESTLT